MCSNKYGNTRLNEVKVCFVYCRTNQSTEYVKAHCYSLKSDYVSISLVDLTFFIFLNKGFHY